MWQLGAVDAVDVGKARGPGNRMHTVTISLLWIRVYGLVSKSRYHLSKMCYLSLATPNRCRSCFGPVVVLGFVVEDS